MGGQSDGINISENFSNANAPEKSSRMQQPSSNQRAEMKGPSDIDSILSNLKTKKVNMSSSPTMAPREDTMSSVVPDLLNDSSTISISDLKDMQSMMCLQLTVQ